MILINKNSPPPPQKKKQQQNTVVWHYVNSLQLQSGRAAWTNYFAHWQSFEQET